MNNQPATIMEVVISAVAIIAVLLTASVSLHNRRTEQIDTLSNTLSTQIADLTASIESRSDGPKRNVNQQPDDLDEGASHIDIKEVRTLLREVNRAEKPTSPND